MHAISFKPQALEDLEQILDYYDQAGPRLSLILEQKVYAVVENAARYPQMYSPVTDQVRRCKIPGFPYLLYYRLGEHTIDVLAVLHEKRHPQHWEDRLP